MPEALTLPGRTGPLAALAWGEESSPKVLAIHGWLDNAASFERLAPLLRGFRVVALDLPGHGHSAPRPPGAFYHFVDWVAEVAQALKALQWDRASLVGHSMGAAVAALFAGTFPDRAERLVLLEALGPFAEPPERAPERLAKAVTEALELPIAPRAFPSLERLVEARAVVGPIERDAARLLMERAALKIEEGVAARTDPRLKQTFPLRLTEPQILAFLRRIACPTLLVRASRGMRMTEEEERERTSAIRGLVVERVDGGHHAHLESPEEVARLVGPFLAAGTKR